VEPHPSPLPRETVAQSRERRERMRAERLERERKLSACLVVRALRALEHDSSTLVFEHRSAGTGGRETKS